MSKLQIRCWIVAIRLLRSIFIIVKNLGSTDWNSDILGDAMRLEAKLEAEEKAA